MKIKVISGHAALEIYLQVDIHMKATVLVIVLSLSAIYKLITNLFKQYQPEYRVSMTHHEHTEFKMGIRESLTNIKGPYINKSSFHHVQISVGLSSVLIYRSVQFLGRCLPAIEQNRSNL